MRTRRLFALAAAGALLGSPGIATSQPVAPHVDPLTAEQIFRAARRAWSFTNYPRYATYTIVTRFRSGGANVTRHYDALEDMRRGIVFAHTFSREEVANPSIPHGFDVRIGSINGQGGAEANAPHNADRIGPLALSVNYDFGISLLPQHTTVVSSGKDIEFPPNLPIIGTTSTATHDYTVRLLGTLDAGKIDHLALEPTHDPGRLRLREMWVDAATFVTRRILVSANFSQSPYTSVPWLIEFAHIGGADYIAKETAEAPLDFDEVSLPDVTISFEDLKLLATLPQYGEVGANDSSEAVSEP